MPVGAMGAPRTLGAPGMAQECPCVVTAELLRELQDAGTAPPAPPGSTHGPEGILVSNSTYGTTPHGPRLVLGQEVPPGGIVHVACGNW